MAIACGESGRTSTARLFLETSDARGQFPWRQFRVGVTHHAGHRINEDGSFDRFAIAGSRDHDEHAEQCVSCAEVWLKNAAQLRQHAVRALAGSGRGWCQGSWCCPGTAPCMTNVSSRAPECSSVELRRGSFMSSDALCGKADAKTERASFRAGYEISSLDDIARSEL